MAAEPRTGSRPRIVVADKQLLFREAVRFALEREGDLQVVGVASDGVEAFEEAQRIRPEVVILTDDLPKCNGIQATALIRERLPDVKVIFLAPEEDQQALAASLEAGASAYLTKRCAFEDMLRPLLDDLIDRRNRRLQTLRVLASLTHREREVLKLLSSGSDNDAIAHALYISPQTARTHVHHILSKLGFHSRLAAGAFAMRDDVLEALVNLQGSATEHVLDGHPNGSPDRTGSPRAGPAS